MNILQKAEALAASMGKDLETLWQEFEAFCEGKKKVAVAAQDESEGSTAASPNAEQSQTSTEASAASTTSDAQTAANTSDANTSSEEVKTQ